MKLAAALATVGAAVAALVVGTHAHRYLLADNRHYTFYLWRKVLHRSPSQRLLLAPVYAAAAALLARSLGRRPLFWRLGLVAATALVLVPAELLELRYYVLPYLMLRLHQPLPTAPWTLVAEAAVYVAVNAATLHLFLNRPFVWPSEPGALQRFMW